jgi:hypothetical protein
MVQSNCRIWYTYLYVSKVINAQYKFGTLSLFVSITMKKVKCQRSCIQQTDPCPLEVPKYYILHLLWCEKLII